ncbi:MAG TPA: HD domain-containing phosphohydrolase [Thermoanaerobaculia bacterium]|nr:HD domain-containing phosphohydrolase [Thermoanaerobaculia bacterium]
MRTPAHLVPYLRALLPAEPRPHAVRAPLLDLYAAADPLLAAHVHRTAHYARLLARKLFPENHTLVLEVELGALLHDLGKLLLPDGLTTAPRPLTEPERRVLERHPVLALSLLESIPLPRPTLDAIAHHHERWDGRGYPSRLAGNRIPLTARIVALCDCFEAVTSDRPHRAALAPRAAFAEINRSAGTQLDALLVAEGLGLLASELAALAAWTAALCPPPTTPLLDQEVSS